MKDFLLAGLGVVLALCVVQAIAFAFTGLIFGEPVAFPAKFIALFGVVMWFGSLFLDQSPRPYKDDRPSKFW